MRDKESITSFLEVIVLPRRVERGFYYKVAWKVCEICNDGERWITTKELLKYFPDLIKLDEVDRKRGRTWGRGTAKLHAALYWLEKKSLLESIWDGKRKAYRPRIDREDLFKIVFGT